MSSNPRGQNPGSPGNPGVQSAFTGLGGGFDPLEWMRRSWQTLNVPPGMLPTVDPEEVQRRIDELRTVEQWLSANLNLLRHSIQGLEMQKAALQAAQAFTQAASTPTGARPQAASKTQAHARAADGPEDSEDPRNSKSPVTGAGGKPSAVAPDPAAWWNALQEQFVQIANTALAGAGGGLPGAASGASEAGNTTGRTAGRAPGNARARAGRSGQPRADKAAQTRTSPRRPGGTT